MEEREEAAKRQRQPDFISAQKDPVNMLFIPYKLITESSAVITQGCITNMSSD